MARRPGKPGDKVTTTRCTDHCSIVVALHRLMINFTSDESEPAWKGYVYAALLFIAAVIQSLCLHQYFHRCFVMGMRLRTAIIAAVYKKVCVCVRAPR